MKTKIAKIDAAVEQLDWAIKLFLDHQACLPAITLAGAAEEILGEAVFNRTSSSSFHDVQKVLSQETKLKPSIISQEYLNKTKNWLKHWKDMRDNEYEEIELEENAIQYIIRAIDNLVRFDRSCSSESPRFINWIIQNRRDVFSGFGSEKINEIKTIFKI